MRTMASPGRGGHLPAMKAAETVYDCRAAAAKLFNEANPENIVFCFNATHALNIAIKSLAKKGTKTLISGYEHNSVLRPLWAIGADIRIIGRKMFDAANYLEELEKNISWAELVVCTHASNAFGYIFPIEKTAEICRKNSVPFIIDASQPAGVLEINQKKLDASFIAMPGHKGLMGPQGTGILICGEMPKAIMEGGSGSDSISRTMPDFLPDMLEAGTHNVPGIAGLHAGINFVLEKGVKNIFNHEQRLLKMFCEELKDGPVELFYDKSQNQTGLISVRHKKLDCEDFASQIHEMGICVRSGLHCAPLAHESAGTLKTGTVRFSFSPFVSETQIYYACKSIRTVS